MSKNPFKKDQKADSKGSAKPEAQDAGQVSAEALVGQVDVVSEEVPVPVVEAPFQPPPPPPQPKAEVKVDTSKFDAKQAKAFIAANFKEGKPVEVIALQDGEHPRSGSWKKAGQTFKLEKAELYSHRWMKLA